MAELLRILSDTQLPQGTELLGLNEGKPQKQRFNLIWNFNLNIYPWFQRTSCMAELQTCSKSPLMMGWRDCFLGPKPC